MPGTPSRPLIYQEFTRGFNAKMRFVVGGIQFPRTSEKPPASTVLAGGFCLRYATKALDMSNSWMLLDLDELVLARAQADLLGMRDARAPVGVGMRDAEGVLGLLALQMLVVVLHLGGAISELGVGQRL